MELKQIMSLVAQGEGQALEFKKSTGELKEGIQTLCGFLNSAGGRVLFGVAEDGKIRGQMVSAQTTNDIKDHLKLIQPPPPYTCDFAKVSSDLQVIILEARPGTAGVPYTYDGRPYERFLDKTTKMPSARHEQLLMARAISSGHWETEPDVSVVFDDLDLDEISRWRESAVQRRRLEAPASVEAPELLERLGLAVKGKLTRAAVALFAKRTKHPYTQCLLKMGRFRGLDVSGPVADSRQERLNTFALVQEGMSFLLRHVPLPSVISDESSQSKNQFLVPERALREILHNAAMHRDYVSPGGYVEIDIFDDRIEISSTGILPPQMTLEALLRPHKSVPRNPLIAEIFFKGGFVDRWGSGVGRVLEACSEASLAAPRFEEREGCFVVTIPCEIVPASAAARGSAPSRHQVGTKSAPSPEEVAILRAVVKPRALTDLMAIVGRKDRTKFRNAILRPMLDSGLLVMTRPDEPRSSSQRYLITAKGAKLLSEMEKS